MFAGFLIGNRPHAQVLEMVPFRFVMRKLGVSSVPGICKAGQALQGQSSRPGQPGGAARGFGSSTPLIPAPRQAARAERSIEVPGGQGR